MHTHFICEYPPPPPGIMSVSTLSGNIFLFGILTCMYLYKYINKVAVFKITSCCFAVLKLRIGNKIRNLQLEIKMEQACTRYHLNVHKIRLKCVA